jgi:hypothetical protein
MIHRLRDVGGGPGPQSDAELLRTYTGGHDEDAFAELLRRHGPLAARSTHVASLTLANIRSLGTISLVIQIVPQRALHD